MDRRGFMGAILATACAPAIVRADSLMRIVPRDLKIIIGMDPASDTDRTTMVVIAVCTNAPFRKPYVILGESPWNKNTFWSGRGAEGLQLGDVVTIGAGRLKKVGT